MHVQTTTMDPRIAKIHYKDFMLKCKAHREKRLAEAEAKRLEGSTIYRRARNDISLMEREDLQLLSAYKALRKGQTILNIDSVLGKCGLNAQKLPNLAIAKAHHKWCHLRTEWHPNRTGRTVKFVSSPDVHVPWKTKNGEVFYRPFQEDSALLTDTDHRRRNNLPDVSDARALVPSVPPHLRPDDMDNGGYHILWEAEWEIKPPVDPLLLKRIDNSQFFVVLAQWDTTPLEQQVLAGRF